MIWGIFSLMEFIQKSRIISLGVMSSNAVSRVVIFKVKPARKLPKINLKYLDKKQYNFKHFVNSNIKKID